MKIKKLKADSSTHCHAHLGSDNEGKMRTEIRQWRSRTVAAADSNFTATTEAYRATARRS